MSEEHVEYLRDPLTGGTVYDAQGISMTVRHNIASDTVYLNGALSAATLEQIRAIVREEVQKMRGEAKP